MYKPTTAVINEVVFAAPRPDFGGNFLMGFNHIFLMYEEALGIFISSPLVEASIEVVKRHKDFVLWNPREKPPLNPTHKDMLHAFEAKMVRNVGLGMSELLAFAFGQRNAVHYYLPHLKPAEVKQVLANNFPSWVPRLHDERDNEYFQALASLPDHLDFTGPQTFADIYAGGITIKPEMFVIKNPTALPAEIDITFAIRPGRTMVSGGTIGCPAQTQLGEGGDPYNNMLWYETLELMDAAGEFEKK